MTLQTQGLYYDFRRSMRLVDSKYKINNKLGKFVDFV